MERDNKETVFEVVSALSIVIGMYTNNQYVLFFSILPLCVTLWYWYENNITKPIDELRGETTELHKDLNMRKEIENIKVNIMEIQYKLKENKKAALNPFLFISLLVIIIIIMMYLRDKGFI